MDSPFLLRASCAIILDKTLTSLSAFTVPLEIFSARLRSRSEWISQTIGGCSFPSHTAIIDIIDFNTRASARFFSSSGRQLAALFIMITDLAVSAITFLRLLILVTIPDRVIILVVTKSDILSRMILSISSLSFSARITMAASGSDSFASISSRITSSILSPNPNIKVWSFSRTRLRPRRNSSSLASKTLVIKATMLEKSINPTMTPMIDVNLAAQLLSPSVSAAEPSMTATYTLHGISAQLLRVSSGRNVFAMLLINTMIKNPKRNKHSRAKKIDELPLDMKLSIAYRSLWLNGYFLLILILNNL